MYLPEKKFQTKYQTLYISKGFTLVEILMVMGITLILTVAVVPIYGNLQVSSQLNEHTSLLIQSVRTARERSISGVNNTSHGVKLFDHRYVLYEGVSYSTRDQAYDRVIVLGDAVSISWTLSGAGQSDEVLFSKGLGVPDMTGTIVLDHEAGDRKIIDVNILGKVEEQ